LLPLSRSWFKGTLLEAHWPYRRGQVTAHEKLPDAAAQAAGLTVKLKARGTAARQLVYEFNKDASKWYPSYAVLSDDRIVTDNFELVAIENLPSNLSLGLSQREMVIPVVPAGLDEGG
ncbi:hypothetical protein, partial [Burkholderia pseudomallei]|uniref:hypothetical protein n=1 Tax=Burkholderia pseudomallei TaxID=28450 RepID=UPI001C9B1018